MSLDNPMTLDQQKAAETEMIAGAAILGLPTSVDPDIAEHMGAFEETALDASEAEESQYDVDPLTGLVFEEFTTEAIDGEQVQ